MKRPVTRQNFGRVAVITVDNPPVNAQSQAVRQGLLDALREAETDDSVSVVILRGEGPTFAAGADLNELAAGRLDPPSPHDIHAAIESSAKPVIAALHGVVLGGGVELALACHYRIAKAGSQLGLPEVTRGLLPGAGGTQRLTRLIGARRALDMMVSGAAVPAATALEWATIDAVVEGDLTKAALEFATTVSTPRRARDLAVDPASLPAEGFDAERAAVRATQGLAIAPELIVDCVEAAATLPFDEGLAFELEKFRRCLASPQAKALLHLFFAERRAARLGQGAPTAEPRPIKNAGVVGAGTMGAGIATALAQAGLAVTMIERDEAALARGLAQVAKNFDSLAARGRLSAQAAAAKQALVSGGLDMAALAGCDLVIEAVFESMAIKREVMAALGKICRPGAILATNTSTLDVDELALASGRPEDVVGLHFFSPAHVMRLLEVVRGAQTAPDVLASALALARPLRKIAVVSGVCHGFIGNRMLEGYLRETDALVLAGVAPERIDRALENFGMAMGPCRMMDMAGVDLGNRLVSEAQASGAAPDYPAYRAMVKALATAGRLGSKNGRGYYHYEGRQAISDPEVARIAAAVAGDLSIPQTPDLSDEEMVERCVLPLINEAAHIVEEGIAQRPSDVDVVWTTGYGFPALRGGPLHHADALGLATVAARLADFAARLDNRHGGWTVAPLIERLATTGGAFADFPQAQG